MQGIKHTVPDQTFKKQLNDMYTTTRKAITNIDALHNKKDDKIARKKQQQLINIAPKKAHEEVFKDKMHSHGQVSKLWKILKQA